MGRALAWRVGTEANLLRTRRGRADLAVFHELAPPPSGGGHQFIRAFVRELERRDVAVELDRLSGELRPASSTRSTSTSPAWAVLGSWSADGPSRGRPDRRVPRVRRRHRRMDRQCERRARVRHDPPVAVLAREAPRARARAPRAGRDPERRRPGNLHRPESRAPLDGRRIRLVATSWSDNPRKGGDALGWLDRNVDHDRYEVTFAGRAPTAFERIRVVDPPRLECARRAPAHAGPLHRPEPRRSVLERACWKRSHVDCLRLYRDSGGHPELVGEAGLPFREDEELGACIERLVRGDRRATSAISIRPIVMGRGPLPRGPRASL